VFLTGLKRLVPHQRSIEEPGRLEEERRLCYVGMTRARKELVLTYAEVRRLYGSEHYTSPSRFLGKSPELIEEVRTQRWSRAQRGAGRMHRRKFRRILACPAVERACGSARACVTPSSARVWCWYRRPGEHARVQVNFNDSAPSGWFWLTPTCSRCNAGLLLE